MKKILFLFAAAAMLISCDPKKPGGEEGTKTDPGTIATADLVAYFPFDADGKDTKGNLTPSNTATTTVTFGEKGQRGNCFVGHTLRDLKSFTASMWVKMEPNTLETTDAPEQMIFQIDGSGEATWGNMFLLQKRNWPQNEATSYGRDHAEMQGFIWKDDAVDSAGNPGWKHQWLGGWFVEVTAPVWRHIICTYNATTSEFHAYVNGTHVLGRANDKDTVYTGVKRWQGDPLAGGAPLGDMKFNNAEKLAIGAWVEKLKGTGLTGDAWAAPMRGRIDEFRIYKTALTEQQVKDLYNAELSQVEEE